MVLSITQLLIRRSLFLRVGSFPNRWGSVSDLNFEMKAAWWRILYMYQIPGRHGVAIQNN